ncbi:DNA fragmentation factor subunit beta isoform X2 [Lampris incognitus]|uniref:DNA fragmentation factor subunit beta isoform X2 n=1 Tax=Lampris incognitus TaxID=2546036 RepID=UPI0024B5F208|nr:DNA fragmentation factor subunit beta isoform X2 [Lampris incognitus]
MSKPVKLRSLNDSRKYGVAAKDVKELLKKGCGLFQMPLVGCRVCLYEDGTEVTAEYFPTLPDHVDLLLLSGGQTWSGFVDDIDRLLSPDRYSQGLVEAARGLLSSEESPNRRRLLSELLLHLEDNSEMESREEDGDWFQGVDARFKTKSSYMKYNCEGRIRGYMKEVDSVARTIQEAKVKTEFMKTAESLMAMLKSAQYNGCYFNRTEKETNRLCTQEGWFTCQGAFDQEACKSLHSINPYGNRESRIVFSTWNLDHRIEKKRTVIPALLDAVQNHRSSDINLNYFYCLLFTRDNLKLVHIVCHKKGAHNLVCDKRKIYKQTTSTDKGKKTVRGKRLRVS